VGKLSHHYHHLVDWVGIFPTYSLCDNKSKMEESLGKRERQPIKCWGCKGDHRYIDFPHRVDRMRIVHNIQEATIVEDVGRSVPRIYATLENRQEEHQSHMIEVEGKITNQPIVILIDSGRNS
jgi:hypothetical protein